MVHVGVGGAPGFTGIFAAEDSAQPIGHHGAVLHQDRNRGEVGLIFRGRQPHRATAVGGAPYSVIAGAGIGLDRTAVRHQHGDPAAVHRRGTLLPVSPHIPALVGPIAVSSEIEVGHGRVPVGHQHGNRFGCGDILFPGVSGIEATINDVVAGSEHGVEGNNHIAHPPAIQRRRGRGPINSIGAGKHAAEICAQVGGAVIHQQTFHIFIVQRRIGLGPAVATVVADVNALRRDVEVRYHPVIAHIGAGAGKQSASGGVDRQTGDHQPVQVKQLFPTVAAVDAAEYPQSAADLLFFIVECYHTGIKNAVHVEHGGQDFVVQRGRCPVPTIAAVVAEVNPAAEAVSIIVGGGIEGAVDPVDAFDGGFIQRRRGDAPGDPSIEGAE